MPKDPLTIDRCMTEIASASADAQRMFTEMSEKMNAASVLNAMQHGYRLACQDNGLPVPDFNDPRKTFGV